MENKLNEENVFKKYIEYHGNKFNQMGFDSKVVWNRRESQLIRFDVLSKMFKSKEGFSILDIGCGLADYYVYLNENGFTNFEYIGFEINPEMVAAIKNKYPNLDVRIGSYNEIHALNRNFDYILACGIHAFGENEDVVQDYFIEKYNKLYEITNKAIGVNFLSIYSSNPDQLSVYHNPAKLLDRCLKNFGSKVSLFHNYLQNDFTILIDK